MKILRGGIAVGLVVVMGGMWGTVWAGDMPVFVPSPPPNLKAYPYVPMAGRETIDPWMGVPTKSGPVVSGGVVPMDSRGPSAFVPGGGGTMTVPFNGPVEWKGTNSPHPEIYHPGPTVQVTPIVPPGRRPVLGTRPEELLEELGVRWVPQVPQAGAATRPGK